MARNTAHLGPYSAPHRFLEPDRRTREGKRARVLRDDLVRHVGGSPNVAQSLLINRVVSLVLRLELMDRRDLEDRRATPRDPREYFYVQNTLTRLLALLGIDQPAAPGATPSLDAIADRYARPRVEAAA